MPQTPPHPTAPNHPSLATQLPANSYYWLIHSLCRTLPDPLTDSPEDLDRRNQAAIAGIAALCPANAAEADLAAQHVAASEQWKEMLRQAQLPETSFQGAMQCRAQAGSMMRQSQGALRMLLRMQAARQKREADNEARDRAAWAEHCAIALMAEALEAKAPSHCGKGLGEGAVPASHHPERASAAEPEEGTIPASHAAHASAAELGEGAIPASQHAAKPDAPVSPQRAAIIRLMKRSQHPDDDLAQTLIDLDLALPGGLRFPPDSGMNGTSLEGIHTAPPEG